MFAFETHDCNCLRHESKTVSIAFKKRFIFLQDKLSPKVTVFSSNQHVLQTREDRKGELKLMNNY